MATMVDTSLGTMTYEEYEQCRCQSGIVRVDPYRAAVGERVVVSWREFKDGKVAKIVGYEVRLGLVDFYDPSNSTTSIVYTVATHDSSGTWDFPAEYLEYDEIWFSVRALADIEDFASSWVDANSYTVRRNQAIPPQRIELSANNVLPGETVTLSWYDAGQPSNSSNKIEGYIVEKYESEDPSVLTSTLEITTTALYGNAYVTAPTTNGAVHRYRVIAKVGGYQAYNSNPTPFVELKCVYSNPTPPPTIMLNGQSRATVHVFPDTSVVLRWSGAEPGINNSITGYDVYRDGVVLVSGLSSDTTHYIVKSSATPGVAYTYTIVATGEHGNSDPSEACVLRSYTKATPPTNLETSKESPAAGAKLFLMWTGAEPGYFNDIVSYEVYVSTEVNGTYRLVAQIPSTDTSASCLVDAPATAGGVYYYRVKTRGAYDLSVMSTAYAQVTAVATPGEDDTDITVIVKPSTRQRRGMVFGEYDTTVDGWTLCEWEFPEPEYQTNYVEVPGRKAGPLDLSTALTGDDPRYNSRELSARFELSDGTRDERNEVLSRMVNELNGQRVDIVLPDDKSRYTTGRLSVRKDYSDLAHASVTVTAVCDPWLYSKTEMTREVFVASTTKTVALSNEGRCILSPTVTVTGYGADVTLVCGKNTWNLKEGKHKLPGLTLPHGNTFVTCSGTGSITFSYREAII